jgi:hypothetical protein
MIFLSPAVRRGFIQVCYNNRVKQTQNQSDFNTWQTVGQLGAKQLLSSFLSFQPANLPHAFLFIGPSGIGKFGLAQEFAAKLAQAWQTEPEQYEFDFAETGSLEELRELIQLSSLTAAGGGKNIFLLRNFQLASAASLNSLLKTLEEPASSSMFLLISDSNGSLPTIMSRVIAVRCFPVVAESGPVKLPSALAGAVTGFPQLANKFENDPEFTATVNQLLAGLDSAANNHRSLVLIGQLAELDTAQLRMLLQLWVNGLKLQLTKTVNPQPLLKQLRAAQTAHDELGHNFNTKLVLQELLLQTKV